MNVFFLDIKEKTSTLSLFDISKTFKNHELQIDNLIKIRYGDIHSVSLFGHPVVVLSSLAAVNDFRAASPENFSHRWTKIVIFLDKEVCIGLEVPYQY